MHRKRFLFTMLLMVGPLLLSIGAVAGKDVKDTIAFNNAAYDKHIEAVVVFDHKKHSTEYFDDYPELYGSSCGECHHDKDNQALVDLKAGDEVESCLSCHKKPEYIKGRAAKGLSKEQRREYHANALHDNCKGCHKPYNKKRRLKPGKDGYAPQTCVTCHDKSVAACGPGANVSSAPAQ